MKFYLILVIPLVSYFSFGQEKTFNTQELTITKWIDGTLLSPTETKSSTLAILIAGSGPTNRDGNQNFLKNNSTLNLTKRITLYLFFLGIRFEWI